MCLFSCPLTLSSVLKIVALLLFQLEPLCYRRMDFEEFCAAAISTHQLEALEGWEQIASTAFEIFEQEGNRVISVEELARVFTITPSRNNSYACFSMYGFLLLRSINAGTESGTFSLFSPERVDQKLRRKAQFTWIYQIFAWCNSSKLKHQTALVFRL